MTAPEEKPANDMIGEYSEDYLLQRAREIVQKRTEGWEIGDKAAEDRIPKFERSQLEIGSVFGKGGFFVVSEVKSITLEEEAKDETSDDSANSLPGAAPQRARFFQRRTTNKKDAETDEDYIQSVVQDHHFMQSHCMRNNGKDCRYALKTMQSDLCKSSTDMFVNTVVDLAIEAKFLAVVRHPHIIKMRAMSVGDDICQSGAFIVLDRLYDTLTDRIHKWEKWESNGFAKLFDFQKKREKSFLAERLTVAYDIASALNYLHDLNIIYRDVKPNNIGFDVRDDVKIFDFGLATEFNDRDKKNGSYRLTGDTGTVRYMAPEVGLNQRYTETADVYSFGILLWQMCALEVPFKNMTDDQVERKAIHCGQRPKINQQWPASVRRLLHDCFASSPRRPTMDVVCDVLRAEINTLCRDTNQKLVDDDVMDSARSAMSARYFN